MSNRDQINDLKFLLLEAKKQLFLVENKEILNKADEQNEVTNKTDKIDDLFNKFETIQKAQKKSKTFEKMNLKFKSNVEFLTNLIKLKSIEKNFKMKEVKNETIFECLRSILNQIQYFFFQTDLLIDIEKLVNDPVLSFEINNETEPILNQTANSSSEQVFPIPVDSLLHSLQMFVNVYDIEWLYYLRKSLFDLIKEIVENLARFIIEFPRSQKVHLNDFYLIMLKIIKVLIF